MQKYVINVILTYSIGKVTRITNPSLITTGNNEFYKK